MNLEVTRAATAVTLALLVTVAVIAATGTPADSAFPGANGKIVTYRWTPVNDYLLTMNPDGTDQRGLMVAPEEATISWSPEAAMSTLKIPENPTDELDGSSPASTCVTAPSTMLPQPEPIPYPPGSMITSSSCAR